MPSIFFRINFMIINQFNDLQVVAVGMTSVTDRLWLAMLIFHLRINTYFGVISTKEPRQQQFLSQLLVAFENK